MKCLPVTVTLIVWLIVGEGDFILHLYRPASCMDMLWNIRNDIPFFSSILVHLVVVWLDWFRGLHSFLSSILHHSTEFSQQCDSMTIVQLICRNFITATFHTVFRGTRIDEIQTRSLSKKTQSKRMTKKWVICPEPISTEKRFLVEFSLKPLKFPPTDNQRSLKFSIKFFFS